MATFPSGADNNNFCVAETGRIEKKFQMQARARGIWTNQIRQKPFPLGMGDTLNKVVWERSNPTTAFQWNVLSLNNGTGSNANPTAQTINPAWSTYQYQLNYGALNSNPVSIHDLALSLEGLQNLSKTFKNLQENVLDIIEDRKQDEYDRVCGHKLICRATGALPESGFNQAWPTTAPDSQINLEFLEEGWDRIMRDGGAQGEWGSLEHVSGQPCPLIFISPEGQRAIFRQNVEHRKDLRYSSQKDRLLNPLQGSGGVNNAAIQSGQAFGHFRYGMNLRAPRYNFTGGAWVRVPYYETSAATTGTKADPGVGYRNASYEVAYLFHPAVMTLCTYNPDPSYDNGVKFDSATFVGKFKWVNNKDNGNNIDGNQGFFRALLASATDPDLTNLGFAWMYKRCRSDRNAIGCTNS